MKKFLMVGALASSLTACMAIVPAKADKVGAVFGGVSGLFLAGPPGAIIGVIVGAVFGKPFWGPDESSWKCYIDDNFHRVCPRLPLR